MNNNPWKALMPYEIEDKNIFFGRNNEISQLSTQIEYNQFVTLYGKSGVGKSSLINAGICPILLSNGYRPHTIRLKSNDDFYNPNISFAEIILSSFSDLNLTTDYSSKDVFCHFFEKYESFNDYGEKITPVIILDQFEDVLIENTLKTELLLKQIVTWTNNNTSITSDCHFVISIREDDLYLLEEILDKNRLNSLKLNRYRLRNLSRKGAVDVIRKGGQNIINDDLVVSKILEILSNKSVEDFETTELSLMCSQLYELMRKHNKTCISVELVDNFGISSIREYYANIVRELKMSKDEVDAFEREFITDSGRRSFLAIDKFKKIFRHDICNKLTESHSRYRLLSITNGKVEIVHDLLANAVKSVKEEHETDKHNQLVKQEKLLCYLSLLPTLLLTLLGIYIILPPIIVSLQENHHISNVFDIFNIPVILNKSLLFLMMISLLWVIPIAIIKRTNLFEHIYVSDIYKRACRIYFGVVLFFIWYIYLLKDLTWWAPGVNYLRFIALGLWIKGRNKQLHKSPFIWLSISLGCLTLFLIRPDFPLMVHALFLISYSLFLIDKINVKFKIGIYIFFSFIFLAELIYNKVGLLYLGTLLLFFVLIFISFREKIVLCVFYILITLGICLGLNEINPYFLAKYQEITKLIPNCVFTTTESDSLYVKDVWKGQQIFDWPLIVKEPRKNYPFGILPVKEVSKDNGPTLALMPFGEYIPGEGYKLTLTKPFVDGIYNNELEKELKDKLSKDSAILKKEILYPIKLNVVEMFDGLMKQVSERIRKQQELSADKNFHYSKIDSLCRIYLEEFKGCAKTKEITEDDFYFYYRITTCQLINSLLQESLHRDEIHKTIAYLTSIVYLNISENIVYSGLNNIINVNVKTNEINNTYTIKGSIVDDETNISKIRNIFDLFSSLATLNQINWMIEDLKNIDSIGLFGAESRKKQFESVFEYEGSPYLKAFCKYQSDLLYKIINEMDIRKNGVYKSYIETILKQLHTIEPYGSNSPMKNLLEYKFREYKEDSLSIVTILKVDSASKECLETLDRGILLEKEVKNLFEDLKSLD